MNESLIIFNAFSFLQKRLKALGFPHSDKAFAIRNGETISEVIDRLGLVAGEVEGAFVNGRILPFETPLKHGDRVSLIPPWSAAPDPRIHR